MAANHSEDFFRNLHLFFYTKAIIVLSKNSSGWRWMFVMCKGVMIFKELPRLIWNERFDSLYIRLK